MSYFVTQKGLEELKQELKQLDEVSIPQALEAVSYALSLGDFKENATLDASRYDLQRLYARKQEIEEILGDYQIIEEDISLAKTKIVQIGSKVKVEYLDENKIIEVKVSGSSESDPLNYIISNESPLAQAILGKTENTEVTFRVKNQKHKVRILNISL